MMLDYVNYTGDAEFRDRVLVPFAREVLLFFDQHYPRGADGKLRLDPAQVVETWWIAVNPAPDVAGLRFCLDELLAMKAGTAEDQARWRKFRGEIPEVSLQTIEGRQAIAPAEKWEKKHNAENGELYPVFPFRCFGLALGTGDIVAWTMKHRSCKDAFGCACWTQDQIHWAYAGNAAEAADGLVRRFRIASPMCRFPLYGREGPDSCPDFDHFGAGSVALQRMLVQEAGDKILLLARLAGRLGRRFQAAPDAAHGAPRNGQGRQAGGLGHSSRHRGRKTWWSASRNPASRRRRPCRRTTTRCAPARTRAVGTGSAARSAASPCFAASCPRRPSGNWPPATARKPVAAPDVVGCWLNPKAGDTLPTQPEDFAGAVSFEAWICPAEKEAGRILDKLTPGKNDGFLWDTWPDLSLRLIAGNQQRSFPGVLKPGVWQHVAVVLDRGIPRVFVDGQLAP